jgi:hypothetical protein
VLSFERRQMILEDEMPKVGNGCKERGYIADEGKTA